MAGGEDGLALLLKLIIRLRKQINARTQTGVRPRDDSSRQPKELATKRRGQFSIRALSPRERVGERV
jgi:hypothetical protein